MAERDIGPQLVPEVEPYEYEWEKDARIGKPGAKAKLDKRPESDSKRGYELPPLVERRGYGDSGSTKEGPHDKTWAAYNYTKVVLAVGGAEVDPEGTRADINVATVEVQYSAYHAEIDLPHLVGAKSETDPQTGESEWAVAGAFAARVGDPTSCCALLGPGFGSENVRIGGQPAWRARVDQHMCPQLSLLLLPHGRGTVEQGEASVLINGQPATRAGDIVVETSGSSTIVGGCPAVQIGQPRGGIAATVLGSSDGESEPLIELDVIGGIDLGYVKAKGKLVGEVDPSKGKFGVGGDKAEVVASAVHLTLATTAKVRIPGTDIKLVMGMKGELDFMTGGTKGRGWIGGKAEVETRYE